MPKLLKSQLNEDFVDTLLTLLNTEQETAKLGAGQIQKLVEGSGILSDLP